MTLKTKKFSTENSVCTPQYAYLISSSPCLNLTWWFASLITSPLADLATGLAMMQ